MSKHIRKLFSRPLICTIDKQTFARGQTPAAWYCETTHIYMLNLLTKECSVYINFSTVILFSYDNYSLHERFHYIKDA